MDVRRAGLRPRTTLFRRPEADEESVATLKLAFVRWAAILVITMPAFAAFAQFIPPAPQEFLESRRRVDGALHICLNMASTLVDFDRALAQALGDALLVPVVFHELHNAYPPTSPYEFTITMQEPDLFVAMNNECDALMGAWLNQDVIPAWLTVTRPYYETRVVFATLEPGAGLRDMPRGAAVGTRIAGSGDFQFRSYTSQLPSGAIRRMPYPSNVTLVERLFDGTLHGTLIWEPAIYRATSGTPSEDGVTVTDLPFPATRVAFGLALLQGATFLRATLDAAIEAVDQAGTIAALIAEYKLPAR